MQDDQLFLPVILKDMNKPWNAVLDIGTPQSFPAKSFIAGCVSPNGNGKRGMYFIQNGRVRLANLNTSGREQVMLYMGKNMLFHEIPMLQFSSGHSFTCMEETDTVFIPRKKLTAEFISKYPELFINLLESMSLKAQSFYTRLSFLRSKGSFNNTCNALYSMYIHNKTNGVVVPVLSKQELAAFLGIHRSSLHKALSRLQEENIIDKYKRKNLQIRAPEQLREYALSTDEDDDDY